MKAILRILTLCSLMFAALSANATIRYVSPNPGSAPYSNINAAFAAAASGDTIVCGPGNYNESLGNYGKRVHIIGAGWDVCTWTGYTQTYNPGSTGSVYEGFRMNGVSYYTQYIFSGADSVTLRRCNITAGNSWPALYLAGGKTFINDCVISAWNHYCATVENAANGNLVIRNTVFNLTTPASNLFALNGNNGATIEIYNCAFLNFTTPFNIIGVPQVIGLNNIFWDWNSTASFGTLPVGSVFEYSASGSGAPSWPSNFANNINLANNNPFVNYATDYYQYGVSDLHLNNSTGGNLCRDAGYPSILDLDNSRSDVGIYGGPKPFVDNGIAAFPFAITLFIDNLVEVGDSVNVVSSGRIGPRY